MNRTTKSSAARLGRLGVIVFGLCVIAAASVSAEKAVAGWYFDQNVQGAYNPLGVQLVSKFYYRMPLMEKEGVLWESTKIDIGLSNSLSPAYDILGVFIDIEPIAVFDLAFSAKAIGYLNAFGFGFREMTDYDAAFDDAALDAIPDENALGFAFTAAPTFKIAVGPVAVLDTFSFSFFIADDGDGYFYEVSNGCVIKKKDMLLVNEAYLLYAFDFGLMTGLTDSILFVPGSGYVSHCLQGVAVYTTEFSDSFSIYAALTAGSFIEDRYYQGKLRIAGQVGITLKL
jgi:hypothetical protein